MRVSCRVQYMYANPCTVVCEAAAEAALQHVMRSESMGDIALSEVLDLRDRRPAAPLENFGRCESLGLLVLSNNEIATLPDAFGDLTVLRDLHLDGN